MAAAATLGMSVSYVDRQTLAAIAPAVRTALRVTHAQYGWLLSAFSAAYLVGAPAAGVLVDRLGARRGFALAVVAWSLVAAGHALVTSFGMLVGMRVLLGLTEAPSFPAAAQAIRRALPSARRPAAYGMLFTGSSIGAMVAGPIAVAIADRASFRAAFVGTAVVGAIWIPFWLTMSRGPGLGAPDDRPAAAPEGWTSVATSVPVLRALVAIFGSAPALMFVLNWTSQYLVERWQMATGSLGAALAVAPLAFDLGAVGFGVVASRGGASEGRTLRLLVVAAALETSLALSPLASSPGAALAVFAAAAAGGGGVYALVTADLIARVPLERTSAVAGLCAAAQSVAHIVAAPLVGRVIDVTHGYGVALVGLGLVVVPPLVAFFVWPLPRRAAER